MNYGIVIYILGWLLEFEGAFLMLPCLVGVIYGENDAFFYALTSLICLVLGFLITRFRPKNKAMYAREGFVIVAFSWHAAFQVASIITTTGFSTMDFDKCPELSKTILLLFSPSTWKK